MSKRIVLSLALLVGAAVSLGAQTHQESFFLKDHILAYRFNPALAPDGDFLAAGVLNYQDRCNYGLSSYMYPVDGKLATFLHPSVSAEDFASRIQADNYFLKAVNYNIISYGIRREDVMHTFEFNLRGYLGTSIPGEALKFVKTAARHRPCNWDACAGSWTSIWSSLMAIPGAYRTSCPWAAA